MVASHRSVILQLRTRLASLRLLSLELEPVFYQLSPLSPERCNAFHLTPITPGFSAEPSIVTRPHRTGDRLLALDSQKFTSKIYMFMGTHYENYIQVKTRITSLSKD